MRCWRGGNWACGRQFNRVAWREALPRGPCGHDAIHTIASMSGAIGAQSMKYDISSLRAPHGVGFDQANASPSLLIDIIELHAQTVGSREANNLDRR